MSGMQSTEVTIKLSRGRIIYGLSNNAYVVGDILDPGHCKHQVQDVVEGQNLDMVDRVLWRAYCHVRKLFEPYLVDEDSECTCDVEANNKSTCDVEAGGDYVFRLLAPGAVPKSTVDYWAILADEYITATAMAEWLEIVSPDHAMPWQRKASEACRQLKESLCHIHRHVRKRMEKV